MVFVLSVAVWVKWLALLCLYFGLALSLTATALYIRTGVREVSARNLEN